MSEIGPTPTGWTCQGSCGISRFESLVALLRSSEAEGLEGESDLSLWAICWRLLLCRRMFAKQNASLDRKHLGQSKSNVWSRVFGTNSALLYSMLCLYATRSDISSDGTAMWRPWKAGLQGIAWPAICVPKWAIKCCLGGKKCWLWFGGKGSGGSSFQTHDARQCRRAECEMLAGDARLECGDVGMEWTEWTVKKYLEHLRHLRQTER